MHRIFRAAALAALLLGLTVPVALAHGGDPNYRSVVHGLRPAVPGVRLSVLGYDNQLQVINQSHRPVLIYGYDHDLYARLLPDGTVQVNVNSPAYYLNEDRFAETPVPKSANAKAPVRWRVLDKTSRFIWHDHRMHWMARTLPPQVKDKHTKTKIFDFAIPMKVGEEPVNAVGTLFWRAQPNGVPTGAIAAFIAIAIAGLVFVGVVRRRRRAGADAEASPRGPEPVGEAW
jgi:hypothetical protein